MYALLVVFIMNSQGVYAPYVIDKYRTESACKSALSSYVKQAPKGFSDKYATECIMLEN